VSLQFLLIQLVEHQTVLEQQLMLLLEQGLVVMPLLLLVEEPVEFKEKL
jgi:hypothetical protein